MNIQQATDLAMEAGFDHAGHLDTSTFEFRQDVRDMCAADKCHSYNKRWTCPPAIGTLDECKERCLKYTDGVAFQTVCTMSNEFDFDAIQNSMEEHGKRFGKLLKLLGSSKDDYLLFGNDGCGNCKECTYPDKPCRFPDKAFPSLEGCGLMVSFMCRDNDIPYYYGQGTVAFTGAFLFNPTD